MSASPSWAAIAAGAIGLAVLDGVVSRSSAVNNVGGWLAGAGKAVRWFLSPAVPAFASAPAPATPTTTVTPAAAATVTPPGSSAASQPNGARLPGVTNPSAQTLAQGGVV